jgi:hexosaminidase
MSDPSAANRPLKLLPWPARVEVRPGRVDLARGLRLDCQPADARIANAALRLLGTEVGPDALGVVMRVGPERGVESYSLTVQREGIAIDAPGADGALRALATLAQLVADGEAPCCEITDAPRFAWRGLMLDVARHYLDAETIARTLDGMALVKLNVLHLHLTDDQAFRFASRTLPRLAATQHYTAGAMASEVATMQPTMMSRPRARAVRAMSMASVSPPALSSLMLTAW